MKEELRSYVQSDRREFLHAELDVSIMESDPFKQFEKWFEQALKAEVKEPYAFTLATADVEGNPSARVLYMRDVTPEGISFFTNYESEKGKHLAENPKCSANFYWIELARQVRFFGTAEKLPEKESEAYFRSRPRESRIGAWASRQSTPLRDRDELMDKLASYRKEFEGREVPRPEYWGGYRIIPTRIEFWQGRESRLHDRISYQRQGDHSWTISRLSP